MNDTQKRIIDNLQCEFQNQQCCDVTVTSSNNKVIKAHRSVLAAGSPVLKKLLEKNKTTINLRQTSSESVKLLLEFLYYGKIEVMNDDNIASILDISHQFTLVTLKKACVDYLRNNLNDLSAIRTVKLCRMYSLDTLTNDAVDYVLAEMKKLD